MMVRDQAVACLTIETHITIESFRITGLLNDESEVNRDPLVRDSGSPCIGGTAIGLCQLGMLADGT